MLHSPPNLLSRHPHGRWPDGSPVQDVANLLDVEHRVSVLIRGGDLEWRGTDTNVWLILDPEISRFSGYNADLLIRGLALICGVRCQCWITH